VPRKLSFGELRVGRGTHEDLHDAFPQLKTRFESGGNLHPLKENPPCFVCEKMRNQHVNDQCLFASTYFTQPSDEEIYYYAVFGYFKGRHA
jgi:hypothetical protein